MSRIGKKPVPLVKGTSATISGQTVEVKGPKGTRSFTAGDDVTLTIENDTIKVTPRGLSKRARQQWGMSRSMIANLVTGVTVGFKKEMEIQGVGYRAAMRGRDLQLQLGFSHEVLRRQRRDTREVAGVETTAACGKRMRRLEIPTGCQGSAV